MNPFDTDTRAALQSEGRKAFVIFGEEGELECPYPIHDQRRTAWFEGYFEARTKERLRKKRIEI